MAGMRSLARELATIDRRETPPGPPRHFLDIDQLDASALDLARQIKLESADVPVVILAGSGDRDLVVKGMRTGAYDFLVKPAAGQRRRRTFRYSSRRRPLAPPGGG